MHEKEETYLGFDLSTQKLKAVQLDSKLQILVQTEVKFDADLPEFRTSGGVNVGINRNEFYVQPVMWIKALDLILERLVSQGANLSTVVCISGSAQQHGSVYWSEYGVNTLQDLDADEYLHVQLSNLAFTINKTPIWMDGSTEKQCVEMEDGVGGRDIMVAITGSKCYPRFTGPQIRKIYQNLNQCYEKTRRISLVSSFLASIFIGRIAPIDYADASGMNLFDINKKIWSKICLDVCAPGLEERLGATVSTCSLIGTICPFFVQKYGFQTNCKVSAFTGDNPSALTGMSTGKNWLTISLGTSDTIMMHISKPTKLQEGHILCHPTENAFMGLLCFRNGSLTREIFKRDEAKNSWQQFSELLKQTPPGNNGNIALHFHTLEIIPAVKGVLRWNAVYTANSSNANSGFINFDSPQTEIRALIEGQMLHRQAVTSDFGFSFDMDTKILATGGASANKEILQVISDIFNAPVYTQKTTEAALLGAAYRAKYSLCLNSRRKNSFTRDYHSFIMSHLSYNLQKVCEPNKKSQDIYATMSKRYREMVAVMESK